MKVRFQLLKGCEVLIVDSPYKGVESRATIYLSYSGPGGISRPRQRDDNGQALCVAPTHGLKLILFCYRALYEEPMNIL